MPPVIADVPLLLRLLLLLLLLLSICVMTVRYIETYHKWGGPASNPSSPWHSQQMSSLGAPGMRSNNPAGPTRMMPVGGMVVLDS
jgi:hypothetical protein